jgi:hypothetical protein
MIKSVALLRCDDEIFDSHGVVVELCDGSGLFECQEVIAIGRSHRQIRFCDGESSVNPVSFDLRTLGDLGSGESERIELFDDTKLLNFEKRCSMSILSVLCEDAFDLSGVVGCLIADNFNGDPCKISFYCCECSSVSEAHTHIASGSLYSGDRHQHTEVFDACDEVFVEACIGADVDDWRDRCLRKPLTDSKP